jgi:hypothetical protein
MHYFKLGHIAFICGRKKWDVPHIETVFGKRTPDDGHILPKPIGNVKWRMKDK